jgi:hypothetical protein
MAFFNQDRIISLMVWAAREPGDRAEETAAFLEWFIEKRKAEGRPFIYPAAMRQLASTILAYRKILLLEWARGRGPYQPVRACADASSQNRALGGRVVAASRPLRRDPERMKIDRTSGNFLALWVEAP